jgi:hypothetical protein
VEANETIAVMAAVALHTDGLAYNANAATGAGQDYPCVGFAETGVVDGEMVQIKTQGTAYYAAGGLVEGDPIYLGETDGAITQTAPTTGGDVVQQVGFAITEHDWKIELQTAATV